jgi:hypothetical protein
MVTWGKVSRRLTTDPSLAGMIVSSSGSVASVDCQPTLMLSANPSVAAFSLAAESLEACSFFARADTSPQVFGTR